MGELLAFKAQRKAPRSVPPAQAEGAEILFFTGVRYMRAQDHIEDWKARSHRPEIQRPLVHDQITC